MKKLQTFFRTYVKSLTDPNYYNDILKSKPSFSFKYYFLFFAFAAVVSTINYHFTIKPQIRDFARTAVSELTTNYPSELELTIADGQLDVVGVTEPYFVPIPEFMSDPEFEAQYDHFITINTTSDPVRDKSLITLGETEATFRRPDGRKESISYADAFEEAEEPVTLNRQMVEIGTSAAQTVLDNIITYSPIAVFFFSALVLPLVTLLVLTIFSLFTLLVSSLMNRGLDYSQSYRIGLHTITFAETVSILQSYLFPQVAVSLYSIAFFGATLFALSAIKAKKTK